MIGHVVAEKDVGSKKYDKVWWIRIFSPGSKSSMSAQDFSTTKEVWGQLQFVSTGKSVMKKFNVLEKSSTSMFYRNMYMPNHPDKEITNACRLAAMIDDKMESMRVKDFVALLAHLYQYWQKPHKSV